jgi:FKBP-type peptidyl-prolyl cis-trans isomerase
VWPHSQSYYCIISSTRCVCEFQKCKCRNAIRQKIESAGKAMLKDMAENPETVTLECGVVLHPLEAGPDGFGKGVRPTAASTVKVHYHGNYSPKTL